MRISSGKESQPRVLETQRTKPIGYYLSGQPASQASCLRLRYLYFSLFNFNTLVHILPSLVKVCMNQPDRLFSFSVCFWGGILICSQQNWRQGMRLFLWLESSNWILKSSDYILKSFTDFHYLRTTWREYPNRHLLF